MTVREGTIRAIAINVSALPASPWKNGGGTTRTIAVSPPDASLDDFDWRISIAEVVSSGDFSRFPGIDRTILLLDGAGMMLHINHDGILPITALFEPYTFSGDDVARAELVNGSTRDFNVMTRRGRAHAEVTVWQSDFRVKDAAVLFCARGAYRIDGGESLCAGWALHVDRPSSEIRFTTQTPDAVMIAVLLTGVEKE